MSAVPDNEDKFIPGIYNYCDRWCERCSFTSRCRVFAMEQEYDLTNEERDLNNDQFWKRLAGIFAETQVMLREKAEEFGIDLTNIDHEAIEKEIEERREAVMNQDLVKLGERYAKEVSRLLDKDEIEVEDTETVNEMLQIVRWYQFMIATKLFRGSDAQIDLEKDDDEDLRETMLSEKDGSIKVALIATDRSIYAWSGIVSSANYSEVKPMIELLETIRKKAEKKFPNARDFIRPGFDEIQAVM